MNFPPSDNPAPPKQDWLMTNATREDLMAEITRLRQRVGELVAERAILKRALSHPIIETRSSLAFRNPKKPRSAKHRIPTPADFIFNFIRSRNQRLAVERTLFSEGQLQSICSKMGLLIEPHEDDDMAWIVKPLPNPCVQ